MIATTAVLLAIAAALTAGIALARRFVRAAMAVGGIVLVLILAKAAWLRDPVVEAKLLPWSWYAAVEPYWPYALAFVLLGSGLWIARKSRPRRILVLIFVAVLLGRVALSIYGELALRPARLLGVPDAQGVCRQSTEYSCGAAAAASFLAARGVAATEREMSALCFTNAVTGTSELGLLAGLRSKGLDPRIGRGDYEWLRSQPKPCLVILRFNRLLEHALVVVEMDERGLWTLDPILGRAWQVRAYFEHRWLGTAIWCD